MPSLESRRQPCCRAEKDIDQNRVKVRDGARLPSDRYGLADAYNPTNTNLCRPTGFETERLSLRATGKVRTFCAAIQAPCLFGDLGL